MGAEALIKVPPAAAGSAGHWGSGSQTARARNFLLPRGASHGGGSELSAPTSWPRPSTPYPPAPQAQGMMRSWLRETLSSAKLYKSSFTKYGNAYKEMIIGKLPEEYYGIPGADATVVKRPFAYAAHVPASNSVGTVSNDFRRRIVRDAGEVRI